MLINNKEILLLKAPKENENDKYETELIKNGFTVKHLQILDFEYINLQLLRQKLNNADSYNGIIFTSPRAVHATKLSLNGSSLKDQWSNKNNYVVGESTYDLVNNELNLICNGKETGNANNLSDLIISENKTENAIYLFPCGNLKKEILVKRLEENKIAVDTTTVYETVQNKNLTEDFKTVTLNFTSFSEYFVYFSPSGVKFLSEISKEYAIPLDKIKLVAIGPSTEEALKNEHLPVYSVAKKPNDKELLDAVLRRN